MVYVDHRNISPADSFIANLNRQEQNKIDRYIKAFAERGKILDQEKFRCEGKPIYAFKGGQARVLCFFLENALKTTLILTHGYSKKSKKLPQTEWDKAYRMYAEVMKAYAN